MANQNLQLHIEITSSCNSRCLDCNRFVKGTDIVIPTLNVKDHMSVETFKNCLVDDLKTIIFTGTYGDFMLHPQLFDILDSIPKQVKLEAETNGGLHDEQWWKRLGGYNFKIVFSIDGIDDETHQMYRRGVKFDRVISNMKAFVEGGGRAVWQMIEFEHNSHQFEDAERMAAKFGVEFRRRRSRLRFDSNKSKIINTKQKRKGISDKELKADKDLIAKTQSVELKDPNETEIVCEWKRKNKVSIDYDGKVWQCCYFSSFYHPTFFENDDEDVEIKLMKLHHKERLDWYENQYEHEWNNVKYRKLSEILNHRFFVRDLEKSFKNRMDDETFPRIQRCAKFCGEHVREREKLYVES